MPQRSVLWLIFFNIYLNDLFYFLRYHVRNFVDDTTPYVFDKNLEFIPTKLEEHFTIATEWFENNHVKMNPGKCHLFVLGNLFAGGVNF